MTDRLLSEKCSTCVFRPGNLMHLDDGRLQDLIRQNREAQTLLVCHQTLPYVSNPYRDDVAGEAYCRGYYDSYGQESSVVQFARMQGLSLREVDPPKKSEEEE